MTIPYEKPIKIIAWIAIIVMVITLIMFGVLARAGGNGDGLKYAIEDYLSTSTGMTAKIETLDALRFFPDIIVDFNGLTMTKAGEDEPSVSVDTVYIAAGFLDFLWRTGKFYKLTVTGMSAKAGTVTEKPLILDGLAILDRPDEYPNFPVAIVGSGILDDTKFTITLPLDKIKDSYRIKKNAIYEIVTVHGDRKAINFKHGKITVGKK